MEIYNKSKDYKSLWKLINNGARVPAWIKHDKGRIDIVEVKIKADNKYLIGTRGVGYEGFDGNKKCFLETCNHFKLEYIEPLSKDNLKTKCSSCGKGTPELCGSCVSDIAQATGEQAYNSRR